jgi:type IV fimbrial biogenesis protein FimT
VSTALRRAEPGFTILELVFVVAIATVLLGIAAPRLLNVSARVAVGDARSKVTSAVATARGAAVRFGRTSYLVLDAAGDRLLVQVDTSALGGALPASLGEVDLWDDLAVNLTATQPMLCFDPRGLAVAASPCTGQGVVVRLSRAGVSDSVVVSAVGRVSP